MFATEGWNVIASMRDPKKEKELGSISGVNLMALDVTDPREIESVAEQVVASGGVDVVFNNAGYGLAGALEGFTDEQIVRLVNTKQGTIRTTKAFIPTSGRSGGTVHQHDFAWWVGVISVQLHLSRNQMGG